MKNFLNFDRLFSPAIVKTLYLALVILFSIRYLWQAFFALLRLDFIGSFSAGIYLVVYPFVLRVLFEVILILFRIYENTYQLAQGSEAPDVVYSSEELKKAVGLGQKPAPHFQANYQYQNPNQYQNLNQYQDPSQYQGLNQYQEPNPYQNYNQAPQGFYQQTPTPQNPSFQSEATEAPQNQEAANPNPSQPNN